jgi:hypothetical protein
MQERNLSRRCLYFTENQVYFQCWTVTYSEDVFSRKPRGIQSKYLSTLNHPFSSLNYPENPLITVPELRKALAEDPNEWNLGFQLYSNLVFQYTKTQLSYESDILNAFAGIINVLENCCGWSFSNGIPENILDFTLLWIPMEGINRRGPDILNESNESQYPSWSWVGWIGSVCHNTDMFCNAYSESQLISAVSGFWIQTQGSVRWLERKEQKGTAR